MSHWIIVPVLLPAVIASLILLGGRDNTVLQRCFSLAGCLGLLAVTVALLIHTLDAPPELYRLGAWPAPYGIVLVLDRLAALMLVLTAALSILVALYATGGWDKRGRHFHTLLQFQLMGVNGAFLTGDVFNLFVFFEVLLIASYGLLLHGGGRMRLKVGVQYVTINLIGSTLFLFAVATLYGVTGTLNMADLAVKLPTLAAGDGALVRTAALLLLIVFAIKAAVVPLHFWLPGAYASASAPVAALFAIMTKVGVYSILRVYTLVFGADGGAAQWIAGPWLLPAALLTLVLGALGVLAARRLVPLACFGLVASVGTLLVAVGLFTESAIGAALYYLIHSTVASAALFLLADLVVMRRGEPADSLMPAPPIRQESLLGGLFFVAAIALVGLPPLSGFVGKLLILDASRDPQVQGWVWAVILGTSLVMLVGFARAGSVVFWKSAAAAPGGNGSADPLRERLPVLPVVAAAATVALPLLLTIFAGPVSGFARATAAQLFAPQAYIAAVLTPPPAEPAPAEDRTGGASHGSGH